MEKLSFVIPCYGSELTINGVLDEIHVMMKQKRQFDYEIICVNDCSPDNVLDVLKKRTDSERTLIVADLTKNKGKSTAVLAGYSLVTGDYIVDLDDDGQCPLDRLWDLFAAVENGSDIVYAGYPSKKQSLFKNFGSKINAQMTYFLIGKPKSLLISNFSIKKRFIIEEALKYKGLYPYTFGICIKTTDKIANVTMEERERAAGKGNFNFKKSFAMWLNGFTAFSVVPLRVSSFLGFLSALIGFIYGVFIIIRKLFFVPDMSMGYPSIMSALLFIGGIIMLMLGMLGEYIGRIYVNQNSLSQYVIRDIYKNKNKGEKNE
ncbi:MAG: glycosyltransferase [Eubacterium sp.]|jgi:undecaprenyl-phosphate 4-deoxy-4-formamido-L-arabinose transferase|nr:glycosyltransferase [Eubacterium sp.]